MDSQEKDTTSSYLQLINCVKSFRGADTYILDVVHKISHMPATVAGNIVVERSSDVANLLSLISTNKI